jgi:hypothetical protein
MMDGKRRSTMNEDLRTEYLPLASDVFLLLTQWSLSSQVSVPKFEMALSRERWGGNEIIIHELRNAARFSQC